MGKGILALFGGGDAGEDGGEESPKDMACKAMFKAIKRDDYESFATAMDDYMRYREGGESESDEDDDEPYSAPKKKPKLFDDE